MSEPSFRAGVAATLSQAASEVAAADHMSEHMSSIALDEQPLPEEEDASSQLASFGTLATLDVSLDSGDSGDVDDAQFVFHASRSVTPAQATTAPAAGPEQRHAAPAPGDRSPEPASPTDRQLPLGGGSSGAAGVGGSDVQIGGLAGNVDAKLSSLLRWGERTFRSTKQLVREQLSSGWRTIDAELEVQVALLKDTQHKYVRLVALTRDLMNHVRSVVETQERLAAHLAELAIKSPELHDDFRLNADSQGAVAKNGRKLLVVLGSFVAGVRTLCTKTIADTLMTFDRYQNARLAFDAYRHEYEMLAHERSAPGTARAEAAKADYDANKATFERLREDVMIKLRLLDENKVKVMHRQMIMYHAAIVSYFSGDQDRLDATLAQFSIRDIEPTLAIGAK